MEPLDLLREKISNLQIDSTLVHELRSVLLGDLIKFSIIVEGHWFINAAIFQACEGCEDIILSFLEQTADYHCFDRPILVFQSRLDCGDFKKESRTIPTCVPGLVSSRGFKYISDIRLGHLLIGNLLVSVHTPGTPESVQKFLKFNTAKGANLNFAILAQLRFNLQFDGTAVEIYHEQHRRCAEWELCFSETCRLKAEGFQGSVLFQCGHEDYKSVWLHPEAQGGLALISREDETEKLPKTAYRGGIENCPWDYNRRARSSTITSVKLPNSVRECSLKAHALGSGRGYELVMAYGLLQCVKRKREEGTLEVIDEGEENSGSDGEIESESEDEEDGDGIKIFKACEEAFQEGYTKPVIGICRQNKHPEGIRFLFGHGGSSPSV